MRTIKFRIWDKKEKKFLGGCFIGNDGKILEYDEGSWTGGWHEFDNVIFSQFTGILDKKGKEVFEGDIIKGTREKKLEDGVFEEHEPCKVVWFDDIAQFGLKGYKGDTIYQHSVEVIGNLYENSELLTN